MHKVRRLYIKAWNYIKNDFETGQEYSIIVQIIVTLSKFPSHTRWKNTLNSQFAFCTHSAVCSLHFVPSLHFVSGLHSAFYTNKYQWQFIFGYSYSHNTYNWPQNTCVRVNSTFLVLSCINTPSFCKNVDITYNVSINLPT